MSCRRENDHCRRNSGKVDGETQLFHDTHTSGNAWGVNEGRKRKVVNYWKDCMDVGTVSSVSQVKVVEAHRFVKC
jgi:hypothetical protein